MFREAVEGLLEGGVDVLHARDVPGPRRAPRRARRGARACATCPSLAHDDVRRGRPHVLRPHARRRLRRARRRGRGRRRHRTARVGPQGTLDVVTRLRRGAGRRAARTRRGSPRCRTPGCRSSSTAATSTWRRPSTSPTYARALRRGGRAARRRLLRHDARARGGDARHRLGTLPAAAEAERASAPHRGARSQRRRHDRAPAADGRREARAPAILRATRTRVPGLRRARSAARHQPAEDPGRREAAGRARRRRGQHRRLARWRACA